MVRPAGDLRRHCALYCKTTRLGSLPHVYASRDAEAENRPMDWVAYYPGRGVCVCGVYGCVIYQFMIQCEHKYLCLDTFGIIQYWVQNDHLGSLNHVSIAKIAKLIWALRFFWKMDTDVDNLLWNWRLRDESKFRKQSLHNWLSIFHDRKNKLGLPVFNERKANDTCVSGMYFHVRRLVARVSILIWNMANRELGVLLGCPSISKQVDNRKSIVLYILTKICILLPKDLH